MYELPPIPDAIDIIKRSMVCHPSLFAAALNSRRLEDMKYAASRGYTPEVSRTVTASADATGRAIRYVEQDSHSEFLSDIGAGVIALNIAAKLQCLPAHVRTSAAVTTWGDK